MAYKTDYVLIAELRHQINLLEAKVKRLQDARLSKFAGQAMIGNCANPNIAGEDENFIARESVRQAKALIAALNDEKED